MPDGDMSQEKGDRMQEVQLLSTQVIGETPKETSNSSTGKCSLKHIKEKPIPRLIPSSCQEGELTPGRHGSTMCEEVAKVDNRRTYSEVVLWINTYLADFGEGPKHVSGDCISKVSASAGRNIGGAQVEEGDLENVGSAKFYENVAPQPDNPRVRRARRTQVEQLGSPVANLPRLRPRNR